MKLLIASDIHGSAAAARKLARRVEAERPDRIVLLGDLLYHGPRNPLPKWYAPMEVADTLNRWRDIVVAVRGNCDSEVDQMVLDFPCRGDYALLEANGRLLYATHGHLAGMAPDDLPPLPAGAVFLSGHTHVKVLERRGDVVVANPGSTSLPKDCSASYLVFEGAQLVCKSLAGEVLMRLDLDEPAA